MEVIPALIGGHTVTAASGATLDAVNPATGETIARFPRMDAVDVGAAVAAAGAAAAAWRATDPGERIARVVQLAERIDARADELARIDVADNGTPIRSMQGFVKFGTDFIRYQANLARQVHGATVPDAHHILNVSVREPYGVVGRLIPFNHPLVDAALKIVPALVTGNTVVLKPSEHTSLSALALCADFAELFPPGVVNVVTGYGAEVGDAIVAHPEVRRIAFVGSAAGGRKVQERAAQVGVKHVTLELGGKNPIVIFPDADLDAATEAVVHGMNFGWQGESCASTSRLLVHESIHDELVARVAARIAAIRIGDPTDAATETGAIVSEAQYEKVRRYIELGKREGRLVTGGDRPADLAPGLFVRPALFDEIAPDARIAQEEIFGPVLVAIRFRDYEEAVRIANSIEYGLTASVFTQDYGTAHRFSRDVQAGYVWVNTPSRVLPGTPYGGVKNSGVGREGDLEDLVSYTTQKNIMFTIPEVPHAAESTDSRHLRK